MSACDPDRTACDGTCVDITVDPEHCGGCDLACDPGLSCQDSACVELETCDGVDNDADRVVDEGSQGEGAATEVVRGALGEVADHPGDGLLLGVVDTNSRTP